MSEGEDFARALFGVNPQPPPEKGDGPEQVPQGEGEDHEQQAVADHQALLASLFSSPPDLSEEPIPNLPPRDKPVGEWSEAEHAADRQLHDQRMRGLAQEQREEAERIRAEASRTPDQQHGDLIRGLANPEVKRAANRQFLQALHPDPDADPEVRQTAAPSFDGEARSAESRGTPAPTTWPSAEPGGWSETEIEDGAALLFPWIDSDGR